MIREHIPDARFVLPVRDGRDVAASVKLRHGDAAPGVERWIAENSIVLAERDSKDVAVYRHEDLVRDPRATLEKISSRVGVPFDDEMLEYHKVERLWFGQGEVENTSGRGVEHRARRNWQINQPIFDNSGRWKTELEESEIAALTTEPGRALMEAFGYLP